MPMYAIAQHLPLSSTGIQAGTNEAMLGIMGPCKNPIEDRVTINRIAPYSEKEIAVKMVGVNKIILPPKNCAKIQPEI